MAYGKGGSKDMEKRMVDLGRLTMSSDLVEIRQKCLSAAREMASSTWRTHLEDSAPNSKEMDAALMPLQRAIRARGLNSVWCEKMRFVAKSAVMEQWKRAQGNLFGRFKNISTRGEKPLQDGHLRLVNLTEDWSRALDDADVAAMQDCADRLDFGATIGFFKELRRSDAGLSPTQASALRAMVEAVETRFTCPQWREDAILQFHLDDRCVARGKVELSLACDALSEGLAHGAAARARLSLAAPAARGGRQSI